MTVKEVEAKLHASEGKRVCITVSDDVTQIVIVDSVDDEGFLHSGPDFANPQEFWTRFEGVKLLEMAG